MHNILSIAQGMKGFLCEYTVENTDLVWVESFVNVHGEIDHVGAREEVELALEQVILVVNVFPIHGQKLQQGNDQVSVKEGAQLGSQLPLSHASQIRSIQQSHSL